MKFEDIKNKVNNFENCSIEEIDDILWFIASGFKEKYNLDFDFSVEFEEGSCVKYERTSSGLQQVEIGNMNLSMMKTDKELGVLIDLEEEKKEFVELVLATFHELRHVMQNHYIQDKPMISEKTLLFSWEKVINDVFPGFITYNYEQSALEIDAMMFSLVSTAEFFESMNFNVSKDEIFKVMKDKELAFCDYDLNKFGESYNSALEYFNSIIDNRGKINGIDKLFKEFNETIDEKQKIKVLPLFESFYEERNVSRQLEILKDIALVVKPNLIELYPLVNNINNKLKVNFKR